MNKFKDYSSWLCPFCKKPGIVAIGDPEIKIADASDGGDGKLRANQLFDHPGCEMHDQFKGFIHNILEGA